MSEKEKNILNELAFALPFMSEFEKGKIIGMCEAIAINNEKNKKQQAAC